MNTEYGYTNGYVERKNGGAYEGKLAIDGVDVSPINAVYFKGKQDGKVRLWLRRNDILEYDMDEEKYIARKRTPQWEAYLTKQTDGNTVAFRGEFFFLRFKYSIVGVWDSILGKEKSRLNLYVERLPMAQQSVLNGINERKRKESER